MSVAELLVIAIVVLLVFGPQRLPELLVQAGKMWRAWQSFINEINTRIHQETDLQSTDQYQHPSQAINTYERSDETKSNP